MAEKAQYKEKRLALLQLQQELPGLQEDAEYHEPPAPAPAPASAGVCCIIRAHMNFSELATHAQKDLRLIVPQDTIRLPPRCCASPASGTPSATSIG